MTWRLISRLIACGLLLGAATGWFLFQPAESDDALARADEGPDASELLIVAAQRLERQTEFQKERTFTGLVKAQRQSNLSFEVSGKVAHCFVDEGSQVEADTPLAELESDRLESQKQQTAAKLGQARALLNELVAGPRQEKIDAKRDQIEELTAIRDRARARMKRADELFEQTAISDQERDEEYYEYLSVESRLLSAQDEMAELEAGTRKEQIEAQEAVVRELEASLKSIEIDIDDTVLTAPFAGTIVSRQIDEGEVVDSGQTVFELIEDSALEIWVGVPVKLTAQLMQRSEFKVSIEGEEFTVERARKIPRLNRETRTQSILFHFAEGELTENIFSGQIARFHFSETIREPGFWVPTDALVRGTRGLWSCYTLTPVDSQQSQLTSDSLFRLERREVEELYTRDGEVFVAGTLRDGDLLLTEGAHRVVQGDRVRVNTESLSTGSLSPESLSPESLSTESTNSSDNQAGGL